MPHAQDAPAFPDDLSVHKSRPSLTTNASGIAESMMSYATMTTAEGLQRLSQFPPPPVGVPISPFEATLGLSEPPQLRGGYMMTPPDSPTTGPVHPAPSTLPTPPKVFSLPLHRQDSAFSGFSMDSTSTVRTSRPLPAPQASSPASIPSTSRTPILSTSGSSPLSPHDWHDGSSSIAMDAYEERMLSTSFITSLLTAVEDGLSPRPPPPRYKRDYYEPSVASDVMSAESSVTYPPRRVFPDSNHPTPPYPPLPDQQSTRLPTTTVLPSTSIPIAGRDTPASLHTSESVAGGGHPTDRSLSLSPSMQSMNSSTPLVPSFPHTEAIQEDPAGEYNSSAGPSTPATSGRKRERRQSTYSSRTTKSYVSSLVTRLSHSTGGDRKSLKQAAHWFRKKPLPPVPRLPDMSLTQEVEYRRAEAALPLPELVGRAQALSQLLDKGHRPHNSLKHLPLQTDNRLEHVSRPSDGVAGVDNFGDDEGVKISGVAPRPNFLHSARGRRNRSQDFKNTQWEAPQTLNSTPQLSRVIPRPFVLSKQHKICMGITLLVAIIVIVIVVAVSVTLSRKHNSQPKCSGNMTGATCSLDATCVCTITSDGQCGNKLAQDLINLLPTLNTLFSANFTPTTLSKAVWLAQGDPGDNCANQARLIDVAPALDSSTSPNRTQWAQTALLWDLVESNNLPDVTALQKFVTSADWSKLSTPDGATSDPSSIFTTRVSGFDFNFAAQTVTAPSATFIEAGQPSQAQISQVNDVARTVLDRMYSFASASATQQQKALSSYWAAVLQQNPVDLNQFLSRVRGSPILLPFDATLTSSNQALSSLLTNSSSAPFPPPLACYPGLAAAQLQTLNAFETSVFGLPSAPAASTFDASCFSDRPIYGILNILQLRLPFTDSRAGVAKQAAALSIQPSEAPSRAIIYSGEVLSALPGSSSLPNITTVLTDPRRFGTLNNMDHVILEYLQSIPDVNVAIALVEFVLSASVVPPTSDSILFNAVATLPTLEIAVFGTVNPSDVDFTASSFSTPTDKLFFGTDQSLAVRDWAIDAVHNMVVWAELSTSPEVVRDTTFTDDLFNVIWDSAFNFFHVPNNAIVGVRNITDGFASENKFSH